MGSTPKCRKLSDEEVKLSEAEDRISDLPKDIIGRILSLCPTKYAVATSILSRKWKWMWTSVTNLDVVFVDSKGCGSEGFIKFIDHVLLSLDSSNLDKFRLTFKQVYPYYKASLVKPWRTALKSWLTTAASRNVCQVVIYMPKRLASKALPDNLFTCETLVVLKLGSVFYLPVPSLVRLENLKTLLLRSAAFQDEDSAYRLISSCPVLEDLSLIKCGGIGFRLLKISAPLLKRLVISYPKPACYRPHYARIDGVDSDEYKIELNTPSLVSFQYSGLVAEGYSIGTLSSLVKAHLDFELCVDSGEDTSLTFKTQDTDTYGTQITELLQGISNVRTLRISDDSVETLELCYEIMEGHKAFIFMGEPDGWDLDCLKLPMFHNLTRLKLGVNARVRWLSLPYLLESSPNLKCLVFFEGLLLCKGDWDWHPHEKVPACLLFSLEILEIEEFQGQQQEVKIVKYFLSNAKSLKTLSIWCEKHKMNKEMLEVRRELLETPRVSSNCEVVISLFESAQ